VIAVGAHEAGGVGRAREAIGTSFLDRGQVGRLDPKRPCNVAEIEAERFALLPQRITRRTRARWEWNFAF
jgi:hypothetical protein